MGALFSVLSGLGSFLTSRFGSTLLVGLAAFAWGMHKADVACDKREALARALAIQAQAVEHARQAKAAESLALRDVSRRGADSAATQAMQETIDRLQAELAKKVQPDAQTKTVPVPVPCVMDDARARRVRQLDAGGTR